jgi:hypothetical protein
MEALHLSCRPLWVFLNSLHQTRQRYSQCWHFVILSFLLSYYDLFLLWPFLPTHCGCRELLFHWSHSVGHTDSVGILWTTDRSPVHDSTQHSQETDIQAPGGIRNSNPSMRAAVDPRLRTPGHRYQLSCDTLSRYADSFRPTTLSPVTFLRVRRCWADVSSARTRTHAPAHTHTLVH